MSRDGAGNYALPAGNPVVTGTTISVTWANTTLTDIGTALTQSISRDGQALPTANLPMSGFKHTGAASATGAGQYLIYGQSGGAIGDLAVSGVLSGVGVTNYLASPPAIGGTLAAAGAFTTLVGTSITGSGAGITALNASNLTSGTVPNAQFPATLPAASAANLTNIPAANLTGTGPGAGGLALNAATITFGTFPSSVTALTQSVGDNSQRLATTAYADTASFTGMTWQDVTGSRALASNYTPSTTRTTMVSVDIISTVSGNYFEVTLTIGVVVVARSGQYSSNPGYHNVVTAIVPPNTNYYITASNGTLSKVMELKP